MIIDFHTHAFPAKVAPRAMEVLQHNAAVIPFHDGTVASLRDYTRKAGVDTAVVLNIATNPKQQKNVNDFAISLLGEDGIIPFGSVHPDAPDALAELERIHAAGIKGIKLHPEYQEFFVDDPKYWPLYQKLRALRLITVFHAGVDIEYFDPVHGSPERLKRALPAFEGGVVVAAHWGGYIMWNEVERHLIGQDVYFDTSYAYSRMPKGQALRMMQNHDKHRFLFGSDMPWSGTDQELMFIDSLCLPAEEKAQLLGGNALRILEQAG